MIGYTYRKKIKEIRSLSHIIPKLRISDELRTKCERQNFSRFRRKYEKIT